MLQHPRIYQTLGYVEVVDQFFSGGMATSTSICARSQFLQYYVWHYCPRRQPATFRLGFRIRVLFARAQSLFIAASRRGLIYLDSMHWLAFHLVYIALS